jgi:hypothetical protein
VSLYRDWHVDGASYHWIAANRASVQLIVQVLAGLLGVAQVSCVRGMVNFSVRRALTQHAMTLDRLGLYNSLSTSQINWSLPAPALLAILITALAALAPAAVWAGALTPVSSNYFVSSTGNATVPVVAYTNRTRSDWEAQWYGATTVQTDKGIFTYGAVRTRFGFFTNDGSTASSIQGGLANMKKADNTNYTYHGRSYGVGASVGILDSHLFDHRQTVRYTFFESGYQTLWTCRYNQTSKSRLELATTQPVNIYVAQGASPITDSLDGGYYVGDLSGGDQIFASKSFFVSVDDWLVD